MLVMDKFRYLIIFLFAFIMNAKAIHPLEMGEDHFVSIEYENEQSVLYFTPLEIMNDGTSIGIVLWKKNDNTYPFVFCAMESENGSSDVYFLSNREEYKLMLLMEVHKLPNHRVRILEVGAGNSAFAKWEIVPYTTELKEVQEKSKKTELWNNFSALAKDVAETYKNGGRLAVSKTYGKTAWEEIYEDAEAKFEAEEARAKKKKTTKKKSTSPKVDKDGCVAYVNDPRLVKVVSKKVIYKDGRVQWTCKVKNISDEPIKYCSVKIKCYDKNGFELEYGIESIDNIEIGDTRIISDSIRLPEMKAKKIKRYEFDISAYAY